MTEVEKIIINKKEILLYRDIETGLYRLSKDAVDVLLKALEEIQAIKNIVNDFALDCGSTVADIEEIWHQLRKYLKIGTVEEFKDLKEKNEPKKMLHNGANWYRCPSGCEVHKKQFEKDWYCPKCGQKLDFGKEE